MFQLSAPREPEWRDVAPGIRILFRFNPTAALNAARRHVREVLKTDPSADPDFGFVCGAAMWGAQDWEGVGAPPAEGAAEDAPVEPAPFSPESLAMLLGQRPDIFDTVAGWYVDPLVELLSEKNG